MLLISAFAQLSILDTTLQPVQFQVDNDINAHFTGTLY